jgi:beta-glucosidase
MGVGALAIASQASAVTRRAAFPRGFLWGAATAGHQVEGNNTSSDLWVVENVRPTLFQQPSGDAINSFALWPKDLEMVRQLGLNSYRFSLEWSRIEPEEGLFSTAMLDHYRAIIGGCRDRGLTPVVTFNHFTVPRWFAAKGGWTNPDAAALFGRYCERAAKALNAEIGYAATLNQPNMMRVMIGALPAAMMAQVKSMNQAAGVATGSANFKNAMIPEPQDVPKIEASLLAAHRLGREAIRAARGDLPVGMTLAVTDYQAAGDPAMRDAKREEHYGTWLDLAKGDDFVGVQNYTRLVWGANGSLPPPKGAQLNAMGMEVYAPSLAGAVRYVHARSGVPVLVTEHGVNTPDDTIRSQLIPSSLAYLQQAISEGVPVIGYIHWTLADNFEWIFGTSAHFGLCAVEKDTLRRIPRPSAAALKSIASRNAI